MVSYRTFFASTLALASASASGFTKRDDVPGTFLVDLKHVDDLFYSVEVEVGSQKEKLHLALNTSTSATWVSGLEDGDESSAAKEAGIFDYTKSTSFTTRADEFAPYDGVYGIWGNDHFTVGGVFISLVDFAVVNATDNDIKGVLGLGLPDPNSTFSPILNAAVFQGVIKRNVYSIWINEETEKNGELLFGGIDYAKFVDPLQVIPLVDGENATRFEIPIDGIVLELAFEDSVQEYNLLNNTYSAILDTGDQYSYLPNGIYDEIVELIGFEFVEDEYYIDSKLVVESVDITFTFQSANISVPLSYFVTENEGRYWFNIYRSEDESIKLGLNFFTSAYVVFDTDNYEVGIVQAILSGSGSEIKAVEGKISDLTSVVEYSTTVAESDFSSASEAFRSASTIIPTSASEVTASSAGSSASANSGNSAPMSQFGLLALFSFAVMLF